MLLTRRSSPGDLEVSGDLAGLPQETKRYIRYEDLLNLKQETWAVNDDVNLPHGTEIAGVPLTALVKLFARDPDLTLVVAICDDKYRASYPRDYLAAHHPVLVLRMNGQSRRQLAPVERRRTAGPVFHLASVLQAGVQSAFA